MTSTGNQKKESTRLVAVAETALIFILFFVLAGTMPPDVNESHYVAKAKHYWNPQWCPQDHFLNSADAHLVFYWTFGWVTRFFELPIATWIGRIVTWILLAWSWRRLSVQLIPSTFFSLLTAALFAAFIRWGHMAGEWVLGGVEAKGFAYVLIWLALESVLRNRWQRAIVLLGGAAAFHIIAGGWALVAVAIAWVVTSPSKRPSVRSLIPALVVSGLLSLLGLVPGLALSWSSDPDLVREANRINVFERLSHHLVFHNLPRIYMARHALLLFVWLGMWYHWRRTAPAKAEKLQVLFRIVLGAVIIALIGVAIDQSLLYLPGLAASILRFYWFRLSDVMLPLGVTFGIVRWLLEQKSRSPGNYNWAMALTLIVVSANVAHVAYEHWSDPRPGAVVQSFPASDLPRAERIRRFEQWKRVCYWIRQNTPADAMFLTPRHQQTFHWYAGRSEVVSGKNFPQDAAGIVQWRKRMMDVFPRSLNQADLSAHGEERLIELAREYSFRYIVLDRTVSGRGLTFPKVYPDSSQSPADYEVYLVPTAVTTASKDESASS